MGKCLKCNPLLMLRCCQSKKGCNEFYPIKIACLHVFENPILACVDIDSDAANSIIRSGCGWVIEPENKRQLIDKLKYISTESQESRIEKGKNGFNYAMSRFSKTINLKKISDLIIQFT